MPIKNFSLFSCIHHISPHSVSHQHSVSDKLIQIVNGLLVATSRQTGILGTVDSRIPLQIFVQQLKAALHRRKVIRGKRHGGLRPALKPHLTT